MVTLFGQVRWEGPAEAQQDDRKESSQTAPPKNMGAALQLSQDADGT
ncbi:hypothetical protein ACVWY3_000183 [Bradyrhizobium sp. USDA 4486]